MKFLTRQPIFVISIFAAFLPSLSQAKPITIAYIGPGTQFNFHSAAGKAIEEEARKTGVQLINLQGVKPDDAKLIKDISMAIDQKVDGIIIGADKIDKLKDVLDKADAAKIPVGVYGRSIPHKGIKMCLYVDGFNAGQASGAYLAKVLPKGSNVVILCGDKGGAAAEGRAKGIEDGLKGSGAKVYTEFVDWKEDQAFITGQKYLSNKEMKIGGLAGCWDPAVLGLAKYVKSSGRRSSVGIVGFDGLPEALAAIKDGSMDATISQPPEEYGRKIVQVMVDYIKGNKPKDWLIKLPATLVTKDNVNSFTK